MAKTTPNNGSTKPVTAPPAAEVKQAAPVQTASATAPVTSTTAAPATQAAPVAKTDAKQVTHEQIARRAYEIYQARGGQHGNHHDDWSQAERELRLGKQ